VAEINQFGSVKPVRSGEGTSCAECEAMLMDALDGVLTAKQQAAFELHIATCAECRQMLADARRGASLLDVLRSPRPEPSAALLERILAQTIGAQTIGAQAIGIQTSGAQTSGLAAPPRSTASGISPLPAIDGAALDIHSVVPISTAPANLLPFRPRPASRFSFRGMARTMMQPRLAMTAAMAFFSITLTLNLTGVHITDLRASDLTPANLKHTFYHANASVVRYYDNLRVVYELESRVNELKRSSDDDNPPAATKPVTKENGDKSQEKPRKTPKSSSGTSERRSPLDEDFRLAGFPRSSSPDHSSIRSIALARPVHKSKETLQEGDQV
jgi:hypothetical protein